MRWLTTTFVLGIQIGARSRRTGPRNGDHCCFKALQLPIQFTPLAASLAHIILAHLLKTLFLLAK
jgi:hypothetical protein